MELPPKGWARVFAAFWQAGEQLCPAGRESEKGKEKKVCKSGGWTKKLLPQMLLGRGDDPVKQARAPGKSLLFLSPPNPLCTGDFGVELV